MTFDPEIIAWYTLGAQHRFLGANDSRLQRERGRVIHTRRRGMAKGLPILVETVRAAGVAINAKPAAGTFALGAKRDVWRPATEDDVALS